MRLASLWLAPTLSLTLAGSVAAKDESKQQQIDANTARIEALEAKTTLSDLDCATDEVAAFSDGGWVCRTPASLLSIYEVRRPVVLESLPTLPLTAHWSAFCDVGDQAIGGGWETPVGSFSYRVVSSHLGSSPRSWTTAITVAAGTITLDGAVYATCLDLTPGS
jgi:hypothetical protein